VHVRIGVIYSPKELDVDLGEDAVSDDVVAQVTASLAGEEGMLWLTDRKGRRVGVVASKVAWVEVGEDSEGRRVGFSAP